MSNFLEKIPVSPITSFGNPSVPNGSTIGTNFSILQTGGYMEVFSLSGLTYTIPPATTGIIEFSGNSIPIQFTKGSGSIFSPDVLTLNSDNISSGRRKLGMLVYVYETDKIYQYTIDDYETLWNNATGATGPGGPTVVISEFGTTVKNNSPEGIAFINAWTASTIEGINGYNETNASWRQLKTGGVSITGGTFNNNTDTLTLNNSTGGTITITGFTDYYTTGFTFNPSTYDLIIQRNDGLPDLLVNLSILSSDVTITGGTYNPSTGTATFTNNTGGTFNVTGFLTGFTDIYVTGGTFNDNTRTLTLTRTDNVNIDISGFTDVFITGGTYDNGTATFTNNTGGTFNLTGLTTPFTGGTVTGATYFTNGVTTNTISAETIYNQNIDIISSLYNIESTGVDIFTGLTRVSSTQFNVAPVHGYIVNNTVTNQIITEVNYSGVSNQTTPYLNTDVATYVLVNSASTLVLLNTYPTPTQRRENIFLGRIAHPDKTSIVTANNTTDFIYSPMSVIRDMFTPIPLINSGVVISPNGINLSFNTSSGTLYGLGINFYSDSKTPDNVLISGSTPTTFQYRTQTGGTSSNTTVIDPSNYDLNGIITPIGSPAKQATNQRVYLFPSGQIRIQYGQKKYSDLTAAIAGVSSESFITFSNNRDNAILIGVISVVSNATDLTDPLQAYFNNVSKFGELLGGTGGISTTTLQQAYNNSSTPEIIINSTLDGLSIKNGTGNPDSSTHLIEGVDSSGNTTSFITASGGFSGSSISATTYYNLPQDIFVTGTTKSGTVATFTNNSGGTFTLTGITDTFTTGATKSGTVATFTNNTGGTFTLTGLTDTFTTGGTYNAGTAQFTNNTGGTFSITGFSTGFGSNPGLEMWGVNYGSTGILYFDTLNRSYGSTLLTNDGSVWTNNTLTTLSFNITASVVWVGDGNNYENINTLYINHSTLGYIQGDSVATNYQLGLSDGYSTSVSSDIILEPNESFYIVGLSRINSVNVTANFVDGRLDIASLFVGEQGPQGPAGPTFTGGVVSGLTATTISATTYQNLPTDIRVTGGTYSGSTIIFTNNTGGTFSVTGITTSSPFTGGTVSGATNFTGGLTANTISATTYNNYIPLPTEASISTGVTLSFITDTVYGTLLSPETGTTITADTTNALLGVTNILIHSGGTSPTFSSEYKKLSGSGNYTTGQVNYIFTTYITSTEIIYSINQRT